METLLPDFLPNGAEEFLMVFPASTNGQASQMGRPRKLLWAPQGWCTVSRTSRFEPDGHFERNVASELDRGYHLAHCLEVPLRTRTRDSSLLRPHLDLFDD
jgi:hypothetical protein